MLTKIIPEFGYENDDRVLPNFRNDRRAGYLHNLAQLEYG
jgi:hypothetical protein